VSELEISTVPFQAPVARTLIGAALADLGERYGGSGDDTPIDPAQFDPPYGVFLVAWLDGSPVGCGGWRSFADTTDLAEIKRMYVTPGVRGRGVATALLRAVEESARQRGRKRAILETGDRQPEAIALYEKAGYVRIEDFGHYRGETGVRSFGRDL
jgi:GNAT superfamily N-acetyltransferase